MTTMSAVEVAKLFRAGSNCAKVMDLRLSESFPCRLTVITTLDCWDWSFAVAALGKLIESGIPFITVEGTLGGGLLAATALNALVESLIEKPDCHCYLSK
jgi:hypothetical protein